jgi:hypothetical protein
MVRQDHESTGVPAPEGDRAVDDSITGGPDSVEPDYFAQLRDVQETILEGVITWW